MQKFLLLITVILFSTGFVCAQPFRYIHGNNYDRDSIKLLKISGYKEYIAPIGKPDEKYLATLVTYDTNGNMTRKWMYDKYTGKQNQWTYTYSADNLLLQHSVFFPDSNTLSQQFLYEYDKQKNQTKYVSKGYSEGKLVRVQTITQKFDEQNRCIEIKQFDQDGKQLNHYAYEYHDFGKKTELVYDAEGKLLYRREGLSVYEQEYEAYGTPEDVNEEFEALSKVTTTYNADGSYTTEDGWEIRKFNSNNMILYRLKKHSQEIWYEYSYYS